MQTSNDYGPEGGQKSFSTMQDRTKSETRCIRFLVIFVVLPLGLVIFAWQAGVCAKAIMLHHVQFHSKTPRKMNEIDNRMQ
jgi:hypothetical protein